jgi:hypothetical protein
MNINSQHHNLLGNQILKLCRSCHGNKKGGIQKKFGYLSSNFMKLCRNFHHSVWQLWGGGWIDKIQNGSRCHGNQGTKRPPNSKILRKKKKNNNKNNNNKKLSKHNMSPKLCLRDIIMLLIYEEKL